ncbi:MAG: LysR family transcriptional regulator [Rhizobiales bacterium]|nr:LysR family transcriptional regulator [Hyphomicrobiales bacterium]
MTEQETVDWDWNELRVVLAVARSGSLSGAARQLGTSHPTVFRRIRLLEQRLGADLFEKSATGYVPTMLGDAIIAAAERMSGELDLLKLQLGTDQGQPHGVLRLTCSDTVYTYVLVPLLARYRSRYPQVSFEVIVTNEFVNLQYQDIDIAFRSSRRTAQNLHGIKLSDLILGVHAHRDHPAVHQDQVRLNEHDWIGFDESMTLTMLSGFMREFDLERKVVFRVNSLIGACDAVRHNIGLAMLPVYVAKSVAEIVPVHAGDSMIRSELWMVSTHAQQRKPLVRAFFEFIENEIGPISDLMQTG